MAAPLTVYESRDADIQDADRARFLDSCAKLAAHGIVIGLVRVASAEELPEGSEVASLGMDALPATVFEGVVVDSGSYPSDSVIVDYVDVPEGVLDAVRSGAPVSTMEYSCSCCNRF